MKYCFAVSLVFRATCKIIRMFNVIVSFPLDKKFGDFEYAKCIEISCNKETKASTF